MKSFKSMIFYLLISMMIFPTVSFSGGGTGPGIIGHGATKSGMAQYFEKRNRIALEYAFDENSEFSKMANDYLLKEVIASSGAPNSAEAAKIILAIKKQVSLMKYSEKNGLDIVFWSKAFSTVAEPILSGYMDSQAPGSSKLISPTKMSVAFATAYAYGFLRGI